MKRNGASLFTRRFDRLTKAAAGVLAGAAVLAVSLTLYAVWPPNQSVGYEPEQPFVFSHAAMAGNSKIPCLYCHFTAESGPMFPTLSKAATPTAYITSFCRWSAIPRSDCDPTLPQGA